MDIKILAVTPDAEKVIEQAGRTCYMSYERAKKGTSGDFVRKLVRSGHFSVLEHATVTIRFKSISRALSLQLLRHRMCSYSQKSQRYVREDNFSYTLPPGIGSNKQAKELFAGVMEESRAVYKKLIDMGIHKEDARYVLPNACHTELTFTTNFRELRYIFQQRGAENAQWEIREAFIAILEKMKEIAPNCFFDLNINKKKRMIYRSMN